MFCDLSLQAGTVFNPGKSEDRYTGSQDRPVITFNLLGIALAILGDLANLTIPQGLLLPLGVGGTCPEGALSVTDGIEERRQFVTRVLHEGKLLTPRCSYATLEKPKLA